MSHPSAARRSGPTDDDDSSTIEEANRVGRIDALFDALHAKRELFRQLHLDRPYPGGVLLDIDQHERAVVVKSVFMTAALAGSPNVGFVVEKTRGSGS